MPNGEFGAVFSHERDFIGHLGVELLKTKKIQISGT
jgi:hypothetical protein